MRRKLGRAMAVATSPLILFQVACTKAVSPEKAAVPVRTSMVQNKIGRAHV